jgi:uncharacterized protein (DUF2062 family)
MWQRWGLFRQFKLNTIRLARTESHTDAVARGLALGVFIGLTPTFGLQLFIAFALACVLRQNKLATFVGVWVTNPLTAPLIYSIEYEIGRLLLGLPAVYAQNVFDFQLNWYMGARVFVPIILGSLALGIPSAIIAYVLALRFVPVLRRCRIPRWPRRL